MIAIGSVCWRRKNAHSDRLTYNRGFGKFPGCNEIKNSDSNSEKSLGLCFPKCEGGFKGHGPLCISQCATKEYPTPCMGGCATSSQECDNVLKSFRTTVEDFLINMMTIVAGAFGDYNNNRQLSFVQIASPVGGVAKGAIDAIKAKLVAGGADKIENAAESFAEQLVDSASNGQRINWAQIDPLLVGAVVNAFKKPACHVLQNN